MTKTYTLEEFKKEKIAINTRTQKEYENLMRFFDSKGFTWDGDEIKATARNYFNAEKETCIRIWSAEKKELSYTSKIYYKLEGYKIILPNQLKEYKEFINKKEESVDLWYEESASIPKKAYDELLKISEQRENLTIGQAIDWMFESEENFVRKLPKTTGRDPRYVSVLSGEPEIIENNIQTDTSKSEIDELKEQLIEVKNKLEKLQEEFDKFKEQFE